MLLLAPHGPASITDAVTSWRLIKAYEGKLAHKDTNIFGIHHFIDRRDKFRLIRVSAWSNVSNTQVRDFL